MKQKMNIQKNEYEVVKSSVRKILCTGDFSLYSVYV